MQSMKQLTMSDIAKLANVGKSTVSRYFNGGYVADETRLKIQEIIEQYDYVPNPTAQALKAKHSYQIAIISPTMESVTSGKVITAMDEEFRSLGYTPFIFNTNHNLERELMSLLSLSRMNVEGVILLATQITDAHLELVSKLSIPVLFVAQASTQVPYITPEDYEAGYALARHVIQKGHQNLLYIGVGEEDVSVGVNRKKGIFQACMDLGVEEPRLIRTDFTYETTMRVLEQQLHLQDETAILCATDTIAFATYHTLHTLGKRVPEDISLASFGGYQISSIMRPSLCTIKFDYEKEGTLAARYLSHLIHQEPFERESVGFTLIEGESVKTIERASQM